MVVAAFITSFAVRAGFYLRRNHHCCSLLMVLDAVVWDGLKGRTRFAAATLFAALPGLDCLFR